MRANRRAPGERDECGVGFVADAAGRSSRAVVQLALEAVGGLRHRGAVAADGISGDGAGLLVPIPGQFFAAVGVEGPGAVDAARVGVIQAFLDATDDAARGRAETAVAQACEAEGLELVGWRTVPVDRAHLGAQALACLPAMRQGLIHRPAQLDIDEAERAALRARRRAQATCEADQLSVYFASFSFRTVTYKGLVTSDRLSQCFPDLADDRFRAPLALFHSRFSTSTSPAWERAQPFRVMCHNGEIISVAGNETRLDGTAVLGTEAAGLGPEELFRPAVARDDSDTGKLDSMMELLVRGGRDLSHALAMLVPAAWESRPDLPQSVRDFYRYHECIATPWEGPAAICVTDGRRVTATVDRNGSRPLRWASCEDGLIVCASETGVAKVEGHGAVTWGRVDPGELLRVDPDMGGLVLNHAVQAHLAKAKPYGQWLAANLRPVPGDTPSPTDLNSDAARLADTPTDSPSDNPADSSRSGSPRLTSVSDVFGFLRPRVAQLTSPVIDPITEGDTMSLHTLLGSRGAILGDQASSARMLELPSFFLYPDTLAAMAALDPEIGMLTLDATFAVADGPAGLRDRLHQLAHEATSAADAGVELLNITAADVGPHRAAVPSLFAVGAVQSALVQSRQRSQVSLVVDAADATDAHAVACLLSVGADAICPRGALWQAERRALSTSGGTSGGGGDVRAAQETCRQLLEAGVRKMIGSVGIATLAAYRSMPIFEVFWLDAEIIELCLPGATPIVGGLSLDDIARKLIAEHDRAGTSGVVRTALLGAEARGVELRHLLDFVPDGVACAVGVVEPDRAIASRLFPPGALGDSTAHDLLASALRALGARPNSTRGPVVASRSSVRPTTADVPPSARTISTARFGVTAGYLTIADELHVASAQARLDHDGDSAQIGTELAWLRQVGDAIGSIEPAAHHDIYSIEDLAQLIYDLKQVNPSADVAIGLLSDSGIGSTASGMVKSLVEVIHIAPTPGSAGRPGIPWEIGLSQAHRELVDCGLRDRVRLRVDGGFASAADILRATLLGADEFTLGIPGDAAGELGSDLASITTNISALVSEVRVQLAALGHRTIDEVIGRTDLLAQRKTGDEWLDSLELSPLLALPEDTTAARHFIAYAGIQRPQAELDHRFFVEAAEGLFAGKTLSLHYDIRNSDRSVGCALGGATALECGTEDPPGNVHAKFRGVAGQSFAAFTGRGVLMELEGVANDFAAKGLGGGCVVIRPGPDFAKGSVLAGNAVLYGATSGQLFVAGGVGQRFAVRNNGADAVVEGAGDDACEYLAGGTIVILGDTGRNLASGISGGRVIVYDPNDRLTDRTNPQTLQVSPLSEQDCAELKDLVATHAALTGSTRAHNLLGDWDMVLPAFKICTARSRVG